jgi:hypothetical protein
MARAGQMSSSASRAALQLRPPRTNACQSGDHTQQQHCIYHTECVSAHPPALYMSFTMSLKLLSSRLSS